MSDAVSDIREASNLTLDFYDGNRIATWVRDHVGVIPWIQSRIGKAVPGLAVVWLVVARAGRGQTQPTSWMTMRGSARAQLKTMACP